MVLVKEIEKQEIEEAINQCGGQRFWDQMDLISIS